MNTSGIVPLWCVPCSPAVVVCPPQSLASRQPGPLLGRLLHRGGQRHANEIENVFSFIENGNWWRYGHKRSSYQTVLY